MGPVVIVRTNSVERTYPWLLHTHPIKAPAIQISSEQLMRQYVVMANQQLEK
jgi:hypothetical protein